MMMNVILFVPLVLFLITVSFGFWVSKTGRPYNSALFNIHKLLALAGVVLTVLRVKSGFPLEDHAGWMAAALAAASVSVVTLFATGAVMSIKNDEPAIAKIIHRAGVFISIICFIIIAIFLI